jgi:hypothetical protein
MGHKVFIMKKKYISEDILPWCYVAIGKPKIIRHKSKMKSKVIIVALFLLLPIFIWLGDVASDRSYVAVIEKPLSLYKTPDQAAYGGGAPIDSLKKNENVKVMRISYGKDYMAVKLEKLNGKADWVVVSDGIRIYKPGNA